MDDYILDDMPVATLEKLYDESNIGIVTSAGHVVGFIFEEDV